MYSTSLFFLAAICLAAAAPVQEQDLPDVHKQGAVSHTERLSLDAIKNFFRRQKIHSTTKSTEKVKM